jgi:hypothetical protein
MHTQIHSSQPADGVEAIKNLHVSFHRVNECLSYCLIIDGGGRRDFDDRGHLVTMYGYRQY